MSALTHSDYAKMLETVDLLSEEQKNDLTLYLHKQSENRDLTIPEKLALLKLIVIDLGPVLPGYSDRREDWYDDDGRLR